jgi:hypothetical protein
VLSTNSLSTMLMKMKKLRERGSIQARSGEVPVPADVNQEKTSFFLSRGSNLLEKVEILLLANDPDHRFPSHPKFRLTF